MRIGLTCAVALAIAATGCETLGFTEQQKDLSSNTTQAGATFPLNPAKQEERIVVRKFVLDLNANPPKVELSLKNEGPDQDLFLAEVEFGYPVPAGSVAPYDPDFRSFVAETFVKNEERSFEVPASSLRTEKPLFARLLVTSGANARMTTACQASGVHGLKRGTLFIDDRVEVVKYEAEFGVEEPWARFTIQNVQNVDDRHPDQEIGNIRYTCQFFDREGKLIPLGRRFYALKPAPKPLGKKGDTVVLEVMPGKTDPPRILVGSKPVLFVTVPKK